MTYPALWMVGAYAVGVLLADWIRPHPLLALLMLFCAMGWSVASRRRVALALLVTAVSLGALRYAYVQTAGRGDLTAWVGQRIQLVGTVVGEPALRGESGVEYPVAVEQAAGHPSQGKAWVTQWSGEPPSFGERITFSGTLKVPGGPRLPGGFDQAAFLARQSIYLTVSTSQVQGGGIGQLMFMQRAAVATRIRLEGVLKNVLPPPQAALLAGLLFGSRSELPDSIKEAFRTSGVLHLLAVSGGNVAMIVLPFMAVLAWLRVPRRLSAVLACCLVIFFIQLTGATPSVLRAGLMVLLVMVGDMLGRERNALNTLGAACLILLLVSPGLLFDLGFQLSAGATLGILLYARPIACWLNVRLQPLCGEKAGRWLAAGLSVTLAAQVMVEPICLHAFGATSVVAPLANLLVLVFLEPIIQLGCLGVMVGLVVLPVAQLIGWLLRLGLWLLVLVVNGMAALPGAYLKPGNLPILWVVLWYVGLAIITNADWRRRLAIGALRVWGHLWAPGWAHKVAAAGVALLVALTCAVWQQVSAGPPDLLKVTFLDVGQGDAILIEAPHRYTMLVDAGPTLPPDPEKGWEGFDAGEQVVVPFLKAEGISHLDYLVVTHSDRDHAGGSESVLRQVSVGALLEGGTEGYEEIERAAERYRVPVSRPVAGEEMRLGSEVMLEILNPAPDALLRRVADTNNNCLALRVRYRTVSMLLACDMEALAEKELLVDGTDLQADLLKVAHHGAGQSSGIDFLRAVQPRVAVLSVGNGNAYGHPHKGTLQRLAEIGAEVYRTDQHGSITVRTDGLRVTISSTRGTPQDDRYHPVGLLGRRMLLAW
ncbi:MAG: DNA internalization-related competence protein ComEC/Rec2 [Mycobacterium leprae]